MLSQMTPPTSGRREVFESDDSGDVFLKIAREEGARRNANENPPDETQSSVVSSRPSYVSVALSRGHMPAMCLGTSGEKKTLRHKPYLQHYPVFFFWRIADLVTSLEYIVHIAVPSRPMSRHTNRNHHPVSAADSPISRNVRGQGTTTTGQARLRAP
jgi:hypothetical protein